MNRSEQRPNILVAIADDASHMSAYGHRFVHTPHFDRVAAEGIRFTQAFTTNPKCAPSRASLLTGRHTWELEEACNHFGLFNAKFAVYPTLLESAGYLVGYTGKGWGPGDWKRGGFARNPAGAEYNRRKLTPPDRTKISDKDYAANFDDFLNDRKDGQPFCFWYGGHEPHRAYEPGEGLRAGKRLEDVEVPAYLPDDPSVRGDLLDYAYELEWFDRQLGRMLARLEALGELDRTLVIVTSDNGMPFPRVKGQMYEQDFRLPLAVRWRDRVRGGRVVDDLISFVDLAPTILEAAGVPVPPEMAGAGLRGILESAGSGKVDPARRRVYMGKERHDVGTEGDVGYPVRCIRTDRYLYVRNFKPELWPAGNPETGFTNVDSSPTKSLILEQHARGEDYYYALSFGKRPAEELYDIRRDPDCLCNLADDVSFAELKEALWRELADELARTGDPRMRGQGDVFDAYEYVGQGKHSWKAYVEGYFEKQKY
ncbi:sulfatase family protein [Paenibacillus sacheonensis]|uniref:Sulfatase-like hydrolase/transferase n=1 Tax=Paenibacillus sacheonensis TaxID=742054 RepID=A0A7X5C1S9_9BACL|nr:sulfatase [Paenibacillus sacheonensis]MBM7569180.1 arylsulfatase A-like enzyme [Paenibacillus sacheonensis]NBC73006.1 sulfatase-like hydrolase/transferase [Paenibacillus sacheonensis]